MADFYPASEPQIDPPPPESDAPMMGNPVLLRTNNRPRSGSSKRAWMIGVPVAAVVLGAGAFVAVGQMHARDSLFANAETTPPPAAAAPAPAPAAPAPMAAVAPPPASLAPAAPPPANLLPPASAPAPMAEAAPMHHERARVLARAEVHARTHLARARAATDSGADVSARAPEAAMPSTTAAPVSAAPASAPPVIDAPPPQ
ncbi:MAG TPA: hypothetical protein VGL58_18355 [Caulobacteraceae bacterium]|jgi:hypothetical protein